MPMNLVKLFHHGSVRLYIYMIAYFHLSVIYIMAYINLTRLQFRQTPSKKNPMPGAHIFIGIDLVSNFF